MNYSFYNIETYRLIKNFKDISLRALLLLCHINTSNNEAQKDTCLTSVVHVATGGVAVVVVMGTIEEDSWAALVVTIPSSLGDVVTGCKI